MGDKPVKYTLLFEEAKSGATIAIGPFGDQDEANAWREEHEPKLDGTFRGSVPNFTPAAAKAANRVQEASPLGSNAFMLVPVEPSRQSLREARTWPDHDGATEAYITAERPPGWEDR